MSYRKPVPRCVSRKLFRKTASKTLKINNAPPVSRGGIRL